MSTAPLITRVVLKNYKSIGACDVSLNRLTFLVGPNGAGKSNFLDALRFVADSLRSSLDHALRDRGGIKEVRRRSAGHPTHFGIRLELQLPSGIPGAYSFRVAAVEPGGYEVQSEECEVGAAQFKVRRGEVQHITANVSPPASIDRLYLVNAAGLPQFRPAYDALQAMGFYSLNPQVIREPQAPDAGALLMRDGRNLPSVLATVFRDERAKQWVLEYLGKVVPGIEGVEAKPVGTLETFEFRQQVEGDKRPWKFPAASMSDGTVRALGILVALAQLQAKVPLVGIEEPEVALHPAAAGVLRDCLRDAAERLQVVVTSHSPELLDDPEIRDGDIRAVIAERGTTAIGPLDDAGRAALSKHLYTAGELLRLNQLLPDPAAVSSASRARLALFGEG